MRSLSVKDWQRTDPNSSGHFTNPRPAQKMEVPIVRGKYMPLSGEAIRMMNYIDDISTTLRRILALSPTLSAEERKRVGEYLKSSSPSADEAMAALNLK
jgi:hypothetical protein